MKNLIVILFAILISTSIYGKEKKFKYTNKVLNHIEFTEITIIIDTKNMDTLLIEGLLKKNIIFDEISCYGKIVFSGDWKLRQFNLSEDLVFGENKFPQNTFIQLNENIDDLNRYFAIRNSRIYKVNTCKFPSNQLINDILCNGEEEVIFKPDWDLLACILAEKDTIAGNILDNSTFVRFDNDKICLYCLYNPIIQDHYCSGANYTKKLWSGSTGILLYPSGKAEYFQPAKNVEIQGVHCKRSPVWGGVYLYESGGLKQCTSAKDQIIDSKLHGEKISL